MAFLIPKDVRANAPDITTADGCISVANREL